MSGSAFLEREEVFVSRECPDAGGGAGRANRLCLGLTRVSSLYTGKQAGPIGSKDLYVSTNS